MNQYKWEKLRQTTWYYPALYGIISALIAIGLTLFDHNVQNFENYKHFIGFFISVDLAIQILNTVALVSATILTFTFSTTMVVLTNYSSQYSPSLVENFLRDTVTLKAFGIFFGGFTYTITSLLLLDINLQQEKVSVASFCIIYVLFDLIYFNRFIRAVIQYIQPSGLVIKLNQEAEKHIDEYENLINGKDIIEWEELNLSEFTNQYKIHPVKDGYIQNVNIKQICNIIEKHSCSAIFDQVVGDFVTIDRPIIIILANEEISEEEISNIKEQLMKEIDIGFVRTGNQDFLFSLQKIMDMSVRSLSNTVYAPNSTLASMNVIRVLLRRIAAFKDGYLIENIDDSKSFIGFKTLNFLKILEEIYDPVIQFGYNNGVIIKYIFESLQTIENGANEENRQKVVKYVEELNSHLQSHKDKYINYQYQDDYDAFLKNID